MMDTNKFTNIVYFCLPFIIPIGLFAFTSVIDSITKKGQVLGIHQLNYRFFSLNTIRKTFFLLCEFLHNFYISCFAFDLAALVSVVWRLEGLDYGISYIGKKASLTIIFIQLGIIIHCLAYIHTVIILREYEKKRVERPLTYLHILYSTMSVLLLLAIRW